MRIVGGRYRGQAITAPKGLSTRPTTDRVRESLFNILDHGLRIKWEGVRVLDLFAGSGALGLEALSRGADFCLFVENTAPARAAIRQNIDHLGLFGQTRLHRRSAIHLGVRPTATGDRFTLAFLDPPYEQDLLLPCLAGLDEGNWLADGAVCVIEQRAKETPATLPPFREVDRRVFGDTQIGFLRYAKK